MRELVEFFVRSRNFILFLLLEVVCFYFIVNTNNYWSATYFNTANRYTAQLLTWSNAVNDFARLRQVNADLAKENGRLNAQLTFLRQNHPPAPAAYRADSVFANRFKYTVAKVIDNTTQLANNYITIDKGTDDGIQPGMAVISPTGVVGKVRTCNRHFSVITSILHSDFFVSSRLVKANEFGPAKWDGTSPRQIKLNDISRYKPVAIGDSVVTSVYNSTFPPDIMVGRVRKVGVRADQTFHDITLDLATDFTTLAYVYIIQNQLQGEQTQLEKQDETDK
jgi:rod shape-determining protein MreC